MSKFNPTHAGSAGSDFADAAQAAQERANKAALASLKNLCPGIIDHDEMPLVCYRDPKNNETCEFAVSFKHGFVQLKKDLMQIGTQAPIGRFVKENWPNINVGDILPNGCVVISVGTITIPSDFEPYKN